jgi:ABC-type branched-subunit amino acid transport system substrate-binding protein
LPDKYDGIYCFNVLHLFCENDRKRFIKECANRAKRDGILFFTVFSEKEDSYGKGAETEKNTFESKPGRPVHYFTESDLKEHFKGMEILEILERRELKVKGYVVGVVFGAYLLGLTLPVLGAEKAPYAIGAVFSVTGGASFLGEPERNTARMVEEWVNAAGGIQGHPLNVIVEDSKSDEAQAVLAVRKLLEKDKVLAVIGPSTTGESMAVVPIMEKAQTPLISCAAALSIVTPKEELDRILAAKTFEMPKKQNPWVFKTAQTDTSAVEAIYDS